MESKQEKIAIVGAGTIGLYLAWKLSEAGHNVTVFEKNTKIEEKPCSGLISERLKNFIPIDQALVENEINSAFIHFPKKTIALNFKFNFLVVSRQRLNEKLDNLAKKSGAKVLFDQSIEEIPQNFDKIIACDGALSRMRENLSLPQPSFRLGLQFFLPIKNSSNFVETWPGNHGFFWKIPRGSQTEYGALGSLSSIKEEFERFCQDQKIIFGREILKSALIPRGLILPKKENVTLCGDASGLTKPWSGGGIIWELTAADILIKNFPDFNRYRKEVKQFFGPKIFFGKISNRLVHFLGKNSPFFLPKKVLIDNDFLLG